VTDDDVTEGKEVRKEQVGDYTIYYTKSNEAGCKVNDYTVVGGDPELLKTVLSRSSPPQFSPALQKALDEADFSADVALAASLQGLPAAGGMPMAGGFDPSKLEGVAVSADLGSSISMSGTLLCVDSDTASELKAKADEMMKQAGPMVGMVSAQMPEIQEAWDSISIGKSGAKLTFSVTIPEALIEQAKRQASGFGPPGAGAGGFGGDGFGNGF
jgi:hypothetical protein